MLLYIGFGVLAAIGILLAFAATRSDTFRVHRSTIIAAPSDAIFALLNDFRLWTKWSPFEKKDLNMKRSYDGTRSGAGSIYSWAGNRQIGEGRMTLVESKPNDRIAIKLEFFKPWKATNQAEFILKPTATGVSVAWTMTGEQKFMCKLMSLFMNMDRMIGQEFEKGLTDLKREAETSVPLAAVAG